MKRIMARVGSYEKDGETKGRYVEIGVIRENDNGEYALLKPTVDLAGTLMQQILDAKARGKKSGESVMAAIWADDDGGQRSQASSGTSVDDDEIPF